MASLISELLLAFLAGYMVHKSRPVLDANVGRGWNELLSYASGAMLALPFVLLIEGELAELNGKTKRTTVAYILAFFALGLGVACGWFLDAVREALT